ncbi:hypothetical protein B0O80DRAFT_429358 [Mortierella sp. GBAus27b]|nr:hypothetical protein B0O80DRAFT_429358 [Mortierella sp. GBAus27b]
MLRSLQQATRIRLPLASGHRVSLLSGGHAPASGSRAMVGSSRLSSIPQRRTAQLFQPSARFSTSAVIQTAGTMAISDQDDDDTFEIPKQQAHSKSVLHDESTPSAWFDPNVIPPEPIKAFRERYNETKNSENPEDREEILSAYRSIADDPELFAQLQPIDFMMAMNSCRDLFSNDSKDASYSR